MSFMFRLLIGVNLEKKLEAKKESSTLQAWFLLYLVSISFSLGHVFASSTVNGCISSGYS